MFASFYMCLYCCVFPCYDVLGSSVLDVANTFLSPMLNCSKFNSIQKINLKKLIIVPVFFRGMNIWVRIRVRMNQITSAIAERVPIFYFHDKTRVQMFYFDFNTTVPLQCAVLAFWKAYVDRMSSV